MDDKIFELMTKICSEMKQQFDVLNKKLDLKADKTDIARFGHIVKQISNHKL